MEILKGQVWGQARVRDKPQGTPDKGESGGRKRREAEKWGGNLVGKSPDRRGRAVSYTHLTLPTTGSLCRSRWSPYH